MHKSLLVIRAHPLTSEQSRSMRMADAFVAVFRENNPHAHVTELALYDVAIPEIDLDLLSAWHKLACGVPFPHLHDFEQTKATLFDHYTNEFLEHDITVVANPLWNLQIPTRLKAWIDTISRAGMTFRYDESGQAVGLVSGKKAVHLQSAGGVFGGQDPANQYVRDIFGFIGITDFENVVMEGVDHDPAHADAIEAAALDQVRVLAAKY